MDRQTPVKTLHSLAVGKDALNVSSYHLLAGYEQCLVQYLNFSCDFRYHIYIHSH